MATYVGGSHEVSSFYRRPSTTTTMASPVSANMGPTTTPTFSKASEGLESVPYRTFTTIKNMQGAIDSKKSEASQVSRYLIFRFVTTDDLLNIERARESGEIDRSVRMTYYVDWDILILKVPTAEHEAAHRNFSKELIISAAGMGSFSNLVQQHSRLLICLKRETQPLIGQPLPSSPDGLNH
jgi:hypothetical protein